MVTMAHPTSGTIVDTQTGGGEVRTSVPAAEQLVRIDLIVDNTTDKLGAQYSLELER